MRPLKTIAWDIENDWQEKVNYAARPYLEAMHYLDSVPITLGQILDDR